MFACAPVPGRRRRSGKGAGSSEKSSDGSS
jgi:hypothetical protein